MITAGESGFLHSQTENCVDVRNSAMIIFSPSLSKSLSSLRLAPTYIGVQRIRPSIDSIVPSSTTLLTNDRNDDDDDETRRKKPRLVGLPTIDAGVTDLQINLDEITTTINNHTPHSRVAEKNSSNVVVYKVIGDDGKERRMTTREKKEYKCQLALEKKKKKFKLPLSRKPEEKLSSAATDVLVEPLQHSSPTVTSSKTGSDNNHLHELPCKPQQQQQQRQEEEQTVATAAALEEEELAFMERCRIPPVMLSTAMMSVPSINNICSASTSSSYRQQQQRTAHNVCFNSSIEIDDEIAQNWAKKIQEQISIAEQLRSQEPIRPIAYTIVPEVWTRMRPLPAIATASSSTNCQTSCTTSHDRKLLVEEAVLAGHTSKRTNSFSDTNNHHDCDDDNNHRQFCVVPMGKLFSDVKDFTLEDDHCIVFNLLYGSKLHISCGAKFGCDFLLYDGPREERHAFAGLRILTTNAVNSQHQQHWQLPIPSPYDLAGFVRCLNTAGKLALLATVIRSNAICNEDVNVDSSACCRRGNVVKVAFVDLVLEKNLTAPTHQRKTIRSSNNKKRKEIGKNLSKKKKSPTRSNK